MRVSPFELEAPARSAPRSTGEPDEADGDARMRAASQERDEPEGSVQEPLDEPGYGHGV